MPLRLHNTLTRSIEPFQPLAPGRVTLYTCGPTVWNYAHIGNFRTFLFEDLLRRWLERSGYDVFHVMNLTDVDDRTIKAARTAGKRLAEHTAPFTKAFFEDRDYMRIKPATVYTAATAYMPQMIALVSRLLDRGVAYKGEDGSVYFALAKFPTYGRLSRLDSREIKVGARVSSDEYAKGDPSDFALWKKADAEDETVGAAWVRLLFWQSHYRQPIDFNDEALASAAEGVKRLGVFHERLTQLTRTGAAQANAAVDTLAAQLEADFAAALDDDLDAPRAQSLLFDFVRDANRELNQTPSAAGAQRALAALEGVMAVLDVLPTPKAADEALAQWVGERLAQREKARKAKDFAAADRIRQELKARSVEIEDTPTGTKWRLV